MKLFWRLYDWNERTFWNSLTKKLMSFLVLFVIDLGYLVVYFREKQAIMAELAQSSIGQDALLRVSQGLDTGASQDSCRLIHAAHRVLFSAWRSRMTASRSGLSVTGPTGDQSRVFPDQRAGLSSYAWRYV